MTTEATRLKNRFSRLLKENGISLTEGQISQLLAYLELLIKWNKVYNLTAICDPKEILTKHLIDSLVISPYLTGRSFIDAGTGPGLPGIPLAIANPDNTFLLADSLGKRIRFLNHVKQSLNLVNIEPLQIRIETLQERKFDGVISRAFASLETMLNLTRNLTTPWGHFYALKGTYPKDEIESIPYGFSLESVIPFTISCLEGARHLIILKKITY